MGAHSVCPPPCRAEDPLADSMLAFVAQTSALTYTAPTRPCADLTGAAPCTAPPAPARRAQPQSGQRGGQAASGGCTGRPATRPGRPLRPPGPATPRPRSLVRAPWRAPGSWRRRRPPEMAPTAVEAADHQTMVSTLRLSEAQSFSGTCLGWTAGSLPFGAPLREGWGVGGGQAGPVGGVSTRGSVCGSSAWQPRCSLALLRMLGGGAVPIGPTHTKECLPKGWP